MISDSTWTSLEKKQYIPLSLSALQELCLQRMQRLRVEYLFAG